MLFSAVSEGTLSLNKAREILQFSQILEKNLCISNMYFTYSYVLFDTQRLNSMLNPLDFEF